MQGKTTILNVRKVQNIIDDVEQSLSCRMNILCIFPDLAISCCTKDQVVRSKNTSHRCTNLVRHGGKEVRLLTIRFNCSLLRLLKLGPYGEKLPIVGSLNREEAEEESQGCQEIYDLDSVGKDRLQSCTEDHNSIDEVEGISFSDPQCFSVMNQYKAGTDNEIKRNSITDRQHKKLAVLGMRIVINIDKNRNEEIDNHEEEIDIKQYALDRMVQRPPSILISVRLDIAHEIESNQAITRMGYSCRYSQHKIRNLKTECIDFQNYP